MATTWKLLISFREDNHRQVFRAGQAAVGGGADVDFDRARTDARFAMFYIESAWAETRWLSVGESRLNLLCKC